MKKVQRQSSALGSITAHKFPAKQSVIATQKCVKIKDTVMKLLPIISATADM